MPGFYYFYYYFGIPWNFSTPLIYSFSSFLTLGEEQSVLIILCGKSGVKAEKKHNNRNYNIEQM